MGNRVGELDGDVRFHTRTEMEMWPFCNITLIYGLIVEISTPDRTDWAFPRGPATAALVDVAVFQRRLTHFACEATALSI